MNLSLQFRVTCMVAMAAITLVVAKCVVDLNANAAARDAAWTLHVKAITTMEAAALARPLWDFNVEQVDSILIALARDPAFRSAQLIGTDGKVAAERKGAPAGGSIAEGEDWSLEEPVLLEEGGKQNTVGKLRATFSRAELTAAWRRQLIQDVVATLGIALITSLAVFGSLRPIMRPLRRLTHVMGALAAGDLNASIPDLARRDEVGAMARAIAVFKDGSIEKLRLEHEAIRLQSAAEAERAAQDVERADNAERQRAVVDGLADRLSQLASGDLTCKMVERLAPEYERLRTDFNAALDQLSGTMNEIVHNTETIRSGNDEVARAAEDLSHRTEQQAVTLEETAAALDEITATVRQSADGATTASAIVGKTTAEAEASRAVVQQAVAAMADIEQSSRQIAQIIGVIDEIAFQTNLLALNAGVEAARAGDAGRGFAVVASEVRALAQRATQAAKEIKTLISASTAQVETGVKCVSDTGQVLGRIVKQVAEVAAVVDKIVATAGEQAGSLSEINNAVNRMDQMTQQNAAMVEQSTAASRTLANEAEELARLTGRFLLPSLTRQTPSQAA